MRTGLGANDLSDVTWDGKSLWIAGSGTLTKRLWGDGHLATDWISYSSIDGFGIGTLTALYSSENLIIGAWQYSGEERYGINLYGDGFSLSLNRGSTWQHISVPILFPDRSDFTYPGWYTITYDIAFSDGTLWCSTTSGFLLKSDNLGTTWTNILPNNETLDLLNTNHHAQCVDAYGDTVWVGTFKGMNVTFDRGQTWTNYSWPETSGGSSVQYPGNFCVSVEHKVVNGKTHVWVGSLDYFGLGKYGICHTEDNGVTWDYRTTTYTAWNFVFGHNGANDPAVSDSTVFAASDSGLVISYNLGQSWKGIEIRESDTLAWEWGKRVFGLQVVADTLWVTSSDGIARTTDWGNSWNIFKGIRRVRTLDTGEQNIGLSSTFDDEKVFAFPNPFTPQRSDQDYGAIKIHYALKNDARITITIYDFSGRLIIELVSREFRSGGRDYQDVWNGRDSTNTIVPNGVYYYLIKTDKGDSARGKIVVLD